MNEASIERNEKADDVVVIDDDGVATKIGNYYSVAALSEKRVRKFTPADWLKVLDQGSPCAWEKKDVDDDSDLCTAALDGSAWRSINTHLLESTGEAKYAIMGKLTDAHGENGCRMKDVAEYYGDVSSTNTVSLETLKKHVLVPVAIKIILMPDKCLQYCLFQTRQQVYGELLSAVPLQYLCSLHGWVDGYAGGLSEEKVSKISVM